MSAKSYRLAIAARYWCAAHLVKSNQVRDAEFMDPIGHLLCMASEITLKSYLLGAGYNDKKLKERIGHNLEKCLWHSISAGLTLDDDIVACILTMKSVHLDNFYRYGTKTNTDGSLKLGIFMLVDEDQAFIQTAKLIDIVAGNGDLLRKRQKHEKPINWPETLPIIRPVDIPRFEMIKTLITNKQSEIHDLDRKIKQQRNT